ncbi:TIGR00725 family protein [Pleurocapsa sp. CCALA 161]|uniref:TIGR00725 family protein n=1 Tax=Pleurocapsa sp. CCALA 161 TaxID=2107688 RepID=UPI000D07B87B|nr:TIGR00725 family protein [Pleurocapsa sp. CCALA 161]PSB07450.1 TIGR00725 family protein [Pleurocapsa sp. CCALA 161]
MAQVVVGVMGAGDLATHEDTELAYQLGKSIAENGWILLTGGRKVGVMEAASQGAKASGGIVIGILPGNNKLEMSDAVDIAIVTDLGNGRNNINVLSCDLVIACGMGLGTASEVALALKNNRPVILLHQQEVTSQFFSHLASEQVFSAANVEQAIALSQEILLP